MIINQGKKLVLVLILKVLKMVYMNEVSDNLISLEARILSLPTMTESTTSKFLDQGAIQLNGFHIIVWIFWVIVTVRTIRNDSNDWDDRDRTERKQFNPNDREDQNDDMGTTFRRLNQLRRSKLSQSALQKHVGCHLSLYKNLLDSADNCNL